MNIRYRLIRERLFKTFIVVITVLICGLCINIVHKNNRNKDGLNLIARAWVATYAERNLSVPPRGPRDGVALEKKPPRHDAHTRTKEQPMWVPGFIDVDSEGLQFAQGPSHPKIRLLIVGGSVAFAQYATTTNRTYFNQLSLRLQRKGFSVGICVLATRGWTSIEELSGFLSTGLSLKPDFVLFLDGLNDLTQFPNLPEHERVQNYLNRLRHARDVALKNGIGVIFAPQPFLPQKRIKTELEKAIIRVYSGPFESIESFIADNVSMRLGLQELIIPGKVWLIDCSGVFDEEIYTTFTDIWHFTDVGQAILAQFLANKLSVIFSQKK